MLAAMILLAALGISPVITIAMGPGCMARRKPEPTLLALVFVQSWAIGPRRRRCRHPPSRCRAAGLSGPCSSRAPTCYCLQATYGRGGVAGGDRQRAGR